MEKLSRETFEKLVAWYEENKRDLPWRKEVSPYRTWISEIMLQQTRVTAAIPYFERWMRLFPTVFDLAAASEESVLKAWEGLGYYSRARNLHRAAKIVAEKFGGELPRDKKELRALPGIGDYTVGAILSIACGEKEPAVDGNVLRVISRLTEDDSDLSKPAARASVADALREVMEEGKESSFTQSLFELGALICLPDVAYRCEACPIAADCRAFRNGTQAKFPVRSEKKEKRTERLTVFLLRVGDLVAVRQRPETGLLAKLFEFPNVKGELSEKEAEALVGAKVKKLPRFSHVFTHVVWEMTGYEAVLPAPIEEKGMRFVSPSELNETYPLPSAFANYKKLL